jgi:polar amino acid transport system substrate-binding protein
MPLKITRRALLSNAVAGGLTVATPKVWAEAKAADQGLLARLRAQKSARVGLANQPPFSVINPDGSLSGLGPTLAKTIMTRLGVPELKGFPATYGDLIPGMRAGRWDFIAAALTITKPRCEQILYSDPILFDVGCFVSLKGRFTDADQPKSVKEVVERKLAVGTTAGGVRFRKVTAAGIAPDKLKQFPSDTGNIDGLLAKRIDVSYSSLSSLKNILKLRKLDLRMFYPVEDDTTHGAALGFRKADTDLHDAFQAELRKIKSSGEYEKLADPFGFSIPAEMMSITSDKLCSED